jgi:hypothetical protein
MKKIALGTTASLGILFLFTLPLSAIAILYATEIAKEYENAGDIKIFLQVFGVYLAILYYSVGFNVVREAFKEKHPYRKWMLSGYGVTVLGKWCFLIYYFTTFYKDLGLSYVVSVLVILAISITVPILLGKTVSKINITFQRVLAYTPIALFGIYLIYLLLR